MSSLRFTKAPPRPKHINEAIWNSEWVGLFVGQASVFPLGIGYLGEGDVRIFDEKQKMYRAPTPSDSMNFIKNQLLELKWVSRGSLIHACMYSTPSRPAILAWLDEDEQKSKEMFAVPDSVARYLP